MNRKNYYQWCKIIMIFLLAGQLIACRDHDKQPDKKIIKPAKTMIVGKPSHQSERRFPGKVIAAKEAHLAFQVKGVLIELPITEGLEMRKGQLIAKLDPVKYQDRVKEAQARYNQAYADHLRATELVKKHFLSRSDYDKKKSEYQMAEANLSTAKHNLQDTAIYAPYHGVIAKRLVENHENIQAKQPIVLYQDLSDIDIRINVPENLMINLKSGQEDKTPVAAIFDSFPKEKFQVAYKEFSSEADAQTQTYDVVFTMPAPTHITVLPGMTVTLIALLPDFKSSGTAYITIPASAVFNGKNNQPAVWVVDENSMQVQEQSVTVSRLAHDQIRVLDGLTPGQRIVTAGVHFIEAGEKIRLMDDQRPRHKP